MRIPKPCLSVRSSRKRNHPGFVNISPTLVNDTSMERSSRVLQHENQKKFIFLKKSDYLSVSPVVFVNNFYELLAYNYNGHIDGSALLSNL